MTLSVNNLIVVLFELSTRRKRLLSIKFHQKVASVKISDKNPSRQNSLELSSRKNFVVTSPETIVYNLRSTRVRRQGGKNANEKCPRAPHTMWIEHSHISVYTRRGSNTPRLALSIVLLFISPFCTHRAHVAFTVNVRSAWQAGNEAGSRGLQRNEGVVVTRTGHCNPRGYRRSKSSPSLPSPPPGPMQNHPLSRSRWEITFCPSITG